MAMSYLNEEEIALLDGCQDASAWKEAAAIIKANHWGFYPDDWYLKVIAPGGVMDRLKKKWNDPDAFKIGIKAINNIKA